ncbi:unnamed protein product [Tuber melanosporum]|uniref:(Perigord truffle) hypothetical protein n=1 Tax=Tuber melanosporum (strain Mel28) TaxID=656061 RepID=D5G8C8_TUBMM|nr:unnamed protein product [Tuber melanosporum]
MQMARGKLVDERHMTTPRYPNSGIQGNG